MRRQRNIFESFPETVDLNQGPNFNGLDLNESDKCNSRNERRDDHHKSPSSWDVGESSSRPNAQEQVATNWSSSHDQRYKDRQFDPVMPLNSGSNHLPMDVDLNLDYEGPPGNADVAAASSSGISSEFGIGAFVYGGQPMVNRESINPHSYSDPNSSQPPVIMPRNLHPFPFPFPFPWNNNTNSRGMQDPTNWSLRSNINNNGGNSSASSLRNDTIRLPNLNSTTTHDHHQQQRSTDYPPWTLFPSSEAEAEAEPEPGGHRGHFRHFSPEESVGPASGSNLTRRHLRSLEVHDDEWRVIAGDIEGRHMLVSEMRQILNAMRRSENIRAEDFDPFINGVADRHRDMRLDVDNMSYEELLALEERIGDVKTGLTEQVILKSMKQRKHMFFRAISTQNLEPCSICREEYVNGDDIGRLDCGHDFHTCCITQWLTLKNLCPICKMTALST